jgi:hypothetical protein
MALEIAFLAGWPANDGCELRNHLLLRGALGQVTIGLALGDSGGDWRGASDGQSALRSHTGESVGVGRGNSISWIGGGGRGGNSRAQCSKHRPDPGAPQRMTTWGVRDSARRERLTVAYRAYRVSSLSEFKLILGDLSRTELEWQVVIPGFPAIHTRRCSSFAKAHRPKTMEVARIPGFSDHYLLLSQRTYGIVLLESQGKVLWAKSPMFCKARWR